MKYILELLDKKLEKQSLDNKELFKENSILRKEIAEKDSKINQLLSNLKELSDWHQELKNKNNGTEEKN